MKKVIWLLLGVTLLCGGSASSQGGDAVVLVLNARNPTSNLSVGAAKNIFLGQTAFWNGTVPIKIYARPGSTSAGESFYGSVVQMPFNRFSQHWTSRQLAGQGVAPESVAGASSVADKIRKSPGGISFMLQSEVNEVGAAGLKVIPLK
jgi:hypothetical protein